LISQATPFGIIFYGIHTLGKSNHVFASKAP